MGPGLNSENSFQRSAGDSIQSSHTGLSATGPNVAKGRNLYSSHAGDRCVLTHLRRTAGRDASGSELGTPHATSFQPFPKCQHRRGLSAGSKPCQPVATQFHLRVEQANQASATQIPAEEAHWQ